MLKAPCLFGFFWLRVHVISLNLIAFIISIETEASLLALAKSIYYYISSLSSRMTAARHAALGMSAKPK